MFSQRCTQRSWFQLPSWSEERGRSEKARQWDCCFFTDDWVRGPDNVPGTDIQQRFHLLFINYIIRFTQDDFSATGWAIFTIFINKRTDKYCFIHCIRQCATRKIESTLVILREFNIGFWLHRYLMNYGPKKKKKRNTGNTGITQQHQKAATVSVICKQKEEEGVRS